MNKRIKQIRRELGLTQAEFASRIGLKQNSIALIESGKRNISNQAILSICREFGVSEEWLRYGTGEAFVPNIDDELEALVKRYGLSSADKVLIERYMSLKADSRETIINFIIDAAASLKDLDTKASSNSDALHDLLDQELAAQKKVEEKSTSSTSIDESETRDIG